MQKMHMALEELQNHATTLMAPTLDVRKKGTNKIHGCDGYAKDKIHLPFVSPTSTSLIGLNTQFSLEGHNTMKTPGISVTARCSLPLPPLERKAVLSLGALTREPFRDAFIGEN